MFLKFMRQKANPNYDSLAGNIKADLHKTFKNKGIDISRICIDVKSGCLNVQVYVGQKMRQPINH